MGPTLQRFLPTVSRRFLSEPTVLLVVHLLSSTRLRGFQHCFKVPPAPSRLRDSASVRLRVDAFSRVCAIHAKAGVAPLLVVSPLQGLHCAAGRIVTNDTYSSFNLALKCNFSHLFRAPLVGFYRNPELDMKPLALRRLLPCQAPDSRALQSFRDWTAGLRTQTSLPGVLSASQPDLHLLSKMGLSTPAVPADATSSPSTAYLHHLAPPRQALSFASGPGHRRNLSLFLDFNAFRSTRRVL
jgi:hypothetical protein